MIDLQQTKLGHWVLFVPDHNTGAVIKIKIESQEQDRKPSAEPSAELLALVSDTAANACSIRDKMIASVRNWLSDPDPNLPYPIGILDWYECNQDLMECFTRNGLPAFKITEEMLLNPGASDLLRLKEIPKLMYLLIEQKKGNTWLDNNAPNELFLSGYILDPWACLWTAGDGYVDGPYGLHLPKNHQIER